MTKWIIFILCVWILGTIFCGMMDGSYTPTGEQSTLEQLMSPSFTNPWSLVTWGGALVKVLSFSYPNIFTPGTPWVWVQWFFQAISVGVLIMLAVTFVSLIRGGGGSGA